MGERFKLLIKIKIEMENFGKFMTVILAMVISPIINGFVVTKLWTWFIVPTFDANPLRIVEAIGLVFIVNYLRMKRDKNADEVDFWSDFASNILFIILYAGFALFSGWIVQKFM